MAFRGVLLKHVEAMSATGFHVVAIDAGLTLPACTFGCSSNLTNWSQQKVVVADSVTHKLLQVARLATVLLQSEERSVIWGVTHTLMPFENHPVGSVPLERYAVASMDKKEKTTFASLENTASLVTAVPLGDFSQHQPSKSTICAQSPYKICYCFQFRSDTEFDLFARTFKAFTRMQQYALLKCSVEMEIKQKYKSRRQKESIRLKVATRKAQHQKLPAPTKTDKQDKLCAKSQAKPKVKLVSPANTMLCILCRTQRPPDGPEHPKHPFVLKDGKGNEVHLCKVCLQRVLQKRFETPQGAKNSNNNTDSYCGLCAQPTAALLLKSIKACAHKICTRVYCLPCVEKLIGKAQSHEVLRIKNWLCPNCSTDKDTDFSTKFKFVDSFADSENSIRAPLKMKKKKRRREVDDYASVDEVEPESQISMDLSREMQPIDYAVTYFKFLFKREMKRDVGESEDVCFCCKDGGNVIECDWKGINNAFARCPKVYHEECLGYSVPDGKTWVCPRHRCQDCGIIARNSCRFCVTSYCDEHLPEEVTRLGSATKDIATSTYIMCNRCMRQIHVALKQKKIRPDFYSKLTRQWTHKQ
ncbi:hypothetical protein CCR75_001852 [Bremia lactucae]|uniref:RING-type domain-containing protein n=1 Tax=Bremia lactucae TaxID=4779 RepID=A0A976FGC5_BRELC|nr:hypothetical protein CCR75_001852 [Bremia lactucae]